LAIVSELQKTRKGQEIVLVSKDIKMRIKARALGLPAEDYFKDQVLEDRNLTYAGVMTLPADFWLSMARTWKVGQTQSLARCSIA